MSVFRSYFLNNFPQPGLWFTRAILPKRRGKSITLRYRFRRAWLLIEFDFDETAIEPLAALMCWSILVKFCTSTEAPMLDAGNK